MSIPNQSDSSAAVPKLPRVLTTWDLTLTGIMAVTPSAPVTVFGIAMVVSLGHALDTILIAMVAMVLTAISYGRMAALYPSAGSAYTYVGRGLNPHLGFLAGWAMLLDYILIPLFCVVYGSESLKRLLDDAVWLPDLPFWVLTLFFAGTMTMANLRGIKTTARTSEIIVAGMMVVLITYIVFAIRFVSGGGGTGQLFSTLPFYNPATFDWSKLATATSFAALTYLGFDSVTTMAEDVKDPKRSVMISTVGVCVFTGVFGGLITYLAVLAWPDYTTFTNPDTAFMDVTKRVGGMGLFTAMAVLLVVANIGAGLTSQAGAARLLFGMGRDGIFPRRFFAHLSERRKVPTYNIIFIALIAIVGARFLNVHKLGELLNFGAFLGFMGVNFAAFWQFFVRQQQDRRRNFFADLLMPGVGFLFCFLIWFNLSRDTMIVGGIWFAVGFAYLAIRTKGFKLRPTALDFSES
jgi:putrescine importer